MAISVYTLYDKSFIKELLGTNLFTGAVYILIVTGVLLSFLSFLGCAGAVKEVKCMLLTVRNVLWCTVFVIMYFKSNKCIFNSLFFFWQILPIYIHIISKNKWFFLYIYFKRIFSFRTQINIKSNNIDKIFFNGYDIFYLVIALFGG